jgi:hypothetical protein
MSAQVEVATDRLLIVDLLLALEGVLPDDQGGGAVLWPDRRDGQPAGARVPRR